MTDNWSRMHNILEVTDPKDIEAALDEYHSRLASTILSKIKPLSPQRIVEIGSGSGRFTMALLKELNNDFEILYCIDSYPGPYHEDKKVLESKLKDACINRPVEIVNKDAQETHKVVSNIDLVIGHEILCDLNSEIVKQVTLACYNALRKGGMYVHSEFSPFALNRSEELLQVSNEYAIEPISDTEWFSPCADELAGIAYRIGFKSISVDYEKIPIRFVKNAAIEMIKRWKTKGDFLEKHKDEINAIGIEYPMEQILYCVK